MKMQIDQSRNGVAAFSVQNIPVKLRRILFFINLSDLIPIQDNPAFYKCFVRCKNIHIINDHSKTSQNPHL